MKPVSSFHSEAGIRSLPNRNFGRMQDQLRSILPPGEALGARTPNRLIGFTFIDDTRTQDGVEAMGLKLRELSQVADKVMAKRVTFVPSLVQKGGPWTYRIFLRLFDKTLRCAFTHPCQDLRSLDLHVPSETRQQAFRNAP